MKMTPPMAAHRLERGCGVWGCDSVGECLACRKPRVSSPAPQKAGTGSAAGVPAARAEVEGQPWLYSETEG